MDDKNKYSESALLAQNKQENPKEIRSSQSLLKKKTNQGSKKCLSKDKKQLNLDEIQLKELHKEESNHQVKVHLQADLTSLASSKKNRRRFLHFKKVNWSAIKRPLPCLFAWSLLISSTGAYCSLVVPRLIDLLDDFYHWASILVAQSILFLYVVVNFLVAIFRDPGRFPKVVISPDDPTFNDDTKSPLYKTVMIKKNNVKIKLCSTCNFYRPPRVSHCSICDSCIDQFDHHCPWLNNCVGKRNYRFFFQFLGYLCVHMILVFCSCLYVALKTSPLVSPPVISSISLMVIIFLLIFPIGGLFIFHIVLVSKGRTTNEHVTGKYKGLNFFSRGIRQNLLHLFCGSLIPKYGVVQLKPKAKIADVEAPDYEQKKANSISSDEYHSDRDNQRLTVSFSQTKINKDEDLLDFVIKNKRKSSLSSDSSISSSMLNQSTRVNMTNNISIDSKRISSVMPDTSLNTSNLKTISS
ncbi:palmitoyltransferase ZDHHC5-like [Brachionus plicatilis]|uniref:Palmitoyltransferase n=1 Tax=Brachionus plicatilis TaxID=10195 RepID=A0A3M7S3C0_BRAPC|nr:palmitoyltransferase ZDHHC5-like [Brachionus plicatilis]